MMTNDNRLALAPAMVSFKQIFFIEPSQFDTGKYISSLNNLPTQIVILRHVQTYNFYVHLYGQIEGDCFAAVFRGTLLLRMKLLHMSHPCHELQ
jgi:hypothetical protein